MLPRWLALCLMPALLVILTQAARVPPPGNSVHNDPDWYYLGNSMQLVMGERAFLMEHPGTPVTVFGALFLWLKLKVFPFTPEPEPVTEVFLHSPEYHRYLGSVSLALAALALFAYGLVLSRRYVPLWVAVACQGLFLWAPHALRFTGRWMPEGLAILLGALYGLLFLGQLARPKGFSSSAALGGALGLMTAVKMHYFPFALLALLRGRKGFFVSLAAAAAVFGAFLLALQPERAQRVPGYFFRMLLNKGVYGSGEQGQPGPGELFGNLRRLGEEHWLSLEQLLWAAAIAALVFFLSLRWRERRHSWVMLAGFAVVGLSVLGQAKHPGARYALPVFVFVPSLLAAFWAVEKARWAKALVGLVVVCMVGSGASLAREEFTNMRREAVLMAAQEREVESRLSARPECLHIFQEAAASYRNANFSANGLAGGAFMRRLVYLFPRTWVYRMSDQNFFRLSSLPVDAEFFSTWLREAQCVFFYVRKDSPDPFGLKIFRERTWTNVFENDRIELRYSDGKR